MPATTEPEGPFLVDESAQSVDEDYAEILPLLAAVTPRHTRAIAHDDAAVRGLKLAKLLATKGVAANLLVLERDGLDASAAVQPGLARRMSTVSRALFYRAGIKKRTSAQRQSRARLPPALRDEAQRVRRELFDILTFVFRGDQRVQATLARVSPGAGYHDQAQDLMILADLATTHSAALEAAVPGLFSAGDATRAAQLASAMLDALADRRSATRDDTDLRLWTLFANTFREAHACLSFLWRNDPAALATIPTLGAKGRRPRRATSKAGPKARGPAAGDS